MTHNCRACGVVLDDDNWSPSLKKIGTYSCKGCVNERSRLWREANPGKLSASVMRWQKANRDKVKIIRARLHRKQGGLTMAENKECPGFLGVHVAERVLSHVFKDVEMMPYGNHGYDFICNRGKKIDVKSSCLNKAGNWKFNIHHNEVADFFLCLAFDNRDNLNPMHIWMLPDDKFNHCFGVSVSPTTIHKWDEYQLDLDKISICCDMIKDV